jgi:hypothetical protein
MPQRKALMKEKPNSLGGQRQAAVNFAPDPGKPLSIPVLAYYASRSEMFCQGKEGAKIPLF